MTDEERDMLERVVEDTTRPVIQRAVAIDMLVEDTRRRHEEAYIREIVRQELELSQA